MPTQLCKITRAQRLTTEFGPTIVIDLDNEYSLFLPKRTVKSFDGPEGQADLQLLLQQLERAVSVSENQQMELPNSLICKKMTSTNYKNILELVRRVTSDITLDYWEDLKNLNVEKHKKPLTFGVRLKSQWIQMGGIDMIVKKQN